jgi:type III pantothenate kinase
LPGLGLQLQSLAQNSWVAASRQPRHLLTPRWALKTPEAIQSGVIYTIIAGIRDFVEDWWQEFPESYITLRGAIVLQFFPILNFNIQR